MNDRCAGGMDMPPDVCARCGATENDLCGEMTGVKYDARLASRAPVTPPDVVERLRADLARLVAAGEAVTQGRQAIRRAMALGSQEWAKACEAYADAEKGFAAALAAIKERTP